MTTTWFDKCLMHPTKNASTIRKILKNGLMTGLPQKTCSFLGGQPQLCQRAVKLVMAHTLNKLSYVSSKLNKLFLNEKKN